MKLLSTPLLLAAATLAAASSAHAADFTWSSNASADWLTAGNWTPGTVPGGTNGPTADRAVFDGVGSQNAVTFGALVGASPNSVGGGSGFGGILVTANQTSALSINNSAGASRNFRFAANAGIAIESGAGAFSMGTSGDAFQLVLQGTPTIATFQNDSANTATLGNKITILPGGSQTPTLNFTGSGDWQVDSVIKGGASVKLTKDGVGTTTLSGANDYAGGTTINAGTLIAKNSTALGTGALNVAGGSVRFDSATAALTVANQISGAGTVEFVGNSGNRVNLNNATISGFTGDFHVLNTGVFAAWTTTPSTASLATTNQNITVDAGGYLALLGGNGVTNSFGALNGAGSITKNNGNSTATLVVGNGDADGSFGGSISPTYLGGAGTINVTKVGAGTQVFSGTNTNAGTALISVTGGTLQFAKTVSLYGGTTGSWTAAKITASSGATLALNVGGTGEFTSANVNTLLTNISVASSATTGLQAGAKIGFDTTNAAGGTFTQGNVIADSTGANGGAIGVTKLGAGTLVLDKANTYTGGTLVNGGTLVVAATTGSIKVGAAGVTVASGATLSVNGTLTLTSNLATLANSGTISLGLSSVLDIGSLFDGQADGSTYQLLTGTTATSGTFGTINWDHNAFSSVTFDSVNGTLTFTAVPEPSTYGLLGAGALAAVAFVRRRRRHAGMVVA